VVGTGGVGERPWHVFISRVVTEWSGRNWRCAGDLSSALWVVDNLPVVMCFIVLLLIT